MTVQFVAGRTYQTRSVGDWDCIYTVKVIARTAKRLTLEQYGKQFQRGIYVYEGVEQCKFLGTYSMCPAIRANRETV